MRLIAILFALLLMCCKNDQQTVLVAEEEAKIKTEYEKRFGIPITDFELSMTSMHFRLRESSFRPIVSVTKTKTGAVAEYYPGVLEAKLGLNEWLDFINHLRKLRVNEWKEKYGDLDGKFSMNSILNDVWELEIFFSNKDKPFKSNGDEIPPNWDEFKKLMRDMEAKIKEKSATEHYSEDEIKRHLEKTKAEYKKRFKKELPDWKLDNKSVLDTLRKALRTGKPYSTREDFAKEEEDAELKNNLKEIKAAYEKKFKKYAPDWKMLLGKECFRRLYRAIEVNSPYPTANEERALEHKLKVEYEKKFGARISDFELSTASVYFSIGSFGHSYISVTRTAKGAWAKYFGYGGVTNKKWLGIELTLDEWLVFVNNLHKLRIDEWEMSYRGKGLNGESWKLEIYPSDKEELKSGGSRAYPPNWKEFIRIMDDIKAKILEHPFPTVDSVKIDAGLRLKYK